MTTAEQVLYRNDKKDLLEEESLRYNIYQFYEFILNFIKIKFIEICAIKKFKFLKLQKIDKFTFLKKSQIPNI